MPKDRTSFQSEFIYGFTKKRLKQEDKGKKPMTEKEAAERRRRLNAKYDQYGNLR